MAIFNKVQISILRETIRSIQKYNGFPHQNNVFYIDSDKIYFQTSHYTVILKMRLLAGVIKPGYALGLDINNLFEMSPMLNRDCWILKTSSIDYNGLAEPVQNIGVEFLVPGYYSSHGQVNSYSPIRELISVMRHGSRVYKLLSSDLHHIKTAIDFVSKVGTHDGSYNYTRNRNICIDSRVYATDDVFGYMSEPIGSILPCNKKTYIPKVISNIIKYSDKDIVVRENISHYNNVDQIELDNDYFTIFYNNPGIDDFHVDIFHENLVDQVTVNKDELVKSLTMLKKTFRTVSKKTPVIDVDLGITINGVFDLMSLRKYSTSRVNNFSKSFNEDLRFNTYGNRFLKILSSIKDDEINIKIPRRYNGGVLINDTYLLMSFMEWI